MKTFAATCVLKTDAILGEGPVWDAARGGLWWVDIERGRVHLWNPSGGDRYWSMDSRAGFAIPAAGGDVIVGTERGLVRLDPRDGGMIPFVHPEAHLPDNRFNDAKCDDAGRLWAGTMAKSEAPGHGSLYRVDADARAHRMAGDIAISNGLAWSPDRRTMYYIDSPTRRVDAFDFDAASGVIANRRTAITIPEGFPDGMAIDVGGNLWIALWGGWGVGCFDPRTGSQLAKIEVPVEAVTSCCFGGPALEDLYITTAGRDLDAAGHARQPLAGSVFHARVGVAGTPTRLFAG